MLLAETADVKRELAESDIDIQLVSEIDPIFSIQPATVFAKILQK